MPKKDRKEIVFSRDLKIAKVAIWVQGCDMLTLFKSLNLTAVQCKISLNDVIQQK